jgi:epoxyqueuosine reductase
MGWNHLDTSLSEKIIARARSYGGIRAGIAWLEDVLSAPSYRAAPEEGEEYTSQPASEEGIETEWPPEAHSVLVLGLYHPNDNPRLDWWYRGNTDGNRRLMEISESLRQWLRKEHGLGAYPLPYHVEWGGLFLKDAAVLAGLGIVGKSNLLLHPEWGPRIRLRSILLEGDFQPTGPIEEFLPCEACDAPCQRVCPQNAFSSGSYHRLSCVAQINADEANKVPSRESEENGKPIMVVTYCRACELACPVGRE